MNKSSGYDAKKDISIVVDYDGEHYLVKTYPNEYRNLMMLIYDKIFPDDFGDCLGMGKCGTCLIKIDQMPGELTSYNRNEQATIRKSGIREVNLRLSCQILVDENLDGLKLTVLNRSV